MSALTGRTVAFKTTVGRRLWAGNDVEQFRPFVTNAALRTFQHQGRIAVIRCRCKINRKPQRKVSSA
ncbi:hypothetical protein OAN307_c23110 [Octadecabacter antarcticus 307]|uniref:Uncharacterized protein n=1 Tax=Octadecabacter antarcticus 307 TaxID=391626 RepID=M9RDQ8_9RHOB|nr:hypothetical protein OAN307_c23110 [Octadecabacter antarcticus 307]